MVEGAGDYAATIGDKDEERGGKWGWPQLLNYEMSKTSAFRRLRPALVGPRGIFLLYDASCVLV